MKKENESFLVSLTRDANDASHSMRTHRANETIERAISSTKKMMKHTYRLLYVILAVIVFLF